MAELLEELLRQCKRGEEAAVRALVDKFSRHAKQLAAAILEDEHLAEDAVQEAFMTALSRLGQLREPRSFAAWLRQIVRSEANRISRRRRERTGENTPPAEEACGPPERLEREELRGLVRRALAQVGEVGRETAELFYFENLSHAELARRLEVPEGTVRRRLHDVREQMRSMLLGYIADRKVPEKIEPPPDGRMPL